MQYARNEGLIEESFLKRLLLKSGNELQAGGNFCGKCGQKNVGEAKEERIPTTIEGERKHVAVLFSDLSGYTAISEKLDPEEVKKITGLLVRLLKLLPNMMALQVYSRVGSVLDSLEPADSSWSR